MNRRSFLSRTAAAPWVIGAGVLMPVKKLIVPDFQLLARQGEPIVVHAPGDLAFTVQAGELWVFYYGKGGKISKYRSTTGVTGPWQEMRRG